MKYLLSMHLHSNIIVTTLALIMIGSMPSVAQPLPIRGVLPWHNFLSGPTAWNASEYQDYLDECQKNGINLIAFHNYTGGGERYLNYVEPMIRIKYKNVLPEAGFDHSGTARWGYLPMPVKDYAFGTASRFILPEGAEYFGADCAITAKTLEERYDKARALMHQVLAMAHARHIQLAMGFEFGVAPPEYASIRTGTMYWSGYGSLVYNPFDPEALGVLYATIEDILAAYPGIDYIWLWLNEHCMFGVDVGQALQNPLMAAFFRQNEKFYRSAEVDDALTFLGVWSQAYIQQAYHRIRQLAPTTGVVIGGWGSKDQLPLLLTGLHQTLPKDIVFTCLNPGMGAEPHPQVFAAIARERRVWAMPWLESDYSLWHLQPRVAKLRAQVKKAFADHLNGVVAIHWRTEEIRLNFETFAHFAAQPTDTITTMELYRTYCFQHYGQVAAQKLAPVLAAGDSSGHLSHLPSEEYYAYTPQTGRLKQDQVSACKKILSIIAICLANETDQRILTNLKWLKSKYEFTLLLDQVSRALKPAWELRAAIQTDQIELTQKQVRLRQAQAELDQAPIRQLFEVYVASVRSRGELGVLSALNQKLWREYLLLRQFILEHS